ncbi:Isoquinoline 1-oxidoreductase subunit [Sphingomonas sp. BK235]|uniref:Isoquinoline 1-oxidoreductase subunit n=1 Tax=Sphingomonas sp. BK235 TaxID=2512131 RepID=UPI00104651FC|nr:Isoquinoline 1-oxidoreductase subunit [Sphingomonas sp. BK235]TCP33571.1 hypothetical protein EV292_10518 [Sphingomonas sp. BK235]
MSRWRRARAGETGRRRRRPGCLPLALVLLAGILLVAGLALRPAALPRPGPLASAPRQATVTHLRPVVSFAAIRDPSARSVALFAEAGRVIQHPRCLNCHPRGDSPTQTGRMRPHLPSVRRGVDGGGEVTLRCTTCHHAANFAPAGVPGHAAWRLAPAEMAWQGRSLGAICRQMLDPARAHMDRAALRRHLAQDALVGWAWHPGGTREPAPGTQEEFGALIAAWLETGARCPA